jgi:hypothetical protein
MTSRGSSDGYGPDHRSSRRGHSKSARDRRTHRHQVDEEDGGFTTDATSRSIKSTRSTRTRAREESGAGATLTFHIVVMIIVESCIAAMGKAISQAEGALGSIPTKYTREPAHLVIWAISYVLSGRPLAAANIDAAIDLLSGAASVGDGDEPASGRSKSRGRADAPAPAPARGRSQSRGRGRPYDAPADVPDDAPAGAGTGAGAGAGAGAGTGAGAGSKSLPKKLLVDYPAAVSYDTIAEICVAAGRTTPEPLSHRSYAVSQLQICKVSGMKAVFSPSQPEHLIVTADLLREILPTTSVRELWLINVPNWDGYVIPCVVLNFPEAPEPQTFRAWTWFVTTEHDGDKRPKITPQTLLTYMTAARTIVGLTRKTGMVMNDHSFVERLTEFARYEPAMFAKLQPHLGPSIRARLVPSSDLRIMSGDLTPDAAVRAWGSM